MIKVPRVTVNFLSGNQRYTMQHGMEATAGGVIRKKQDSDIND